MSTSHIAPDPHAPTDTKLADADLLDSKTSKPSQSSTPKPPPESGQPPSIKKSRLNPIWQARLKRFKSNRLGLISLIIFAIIFVICMTVNVIANDKPLMVQYDGGYYFPVAKAYPETSFGGIFETETNYKDPAVQQLIN